MRNIIAALIVMSLGIALGACSKCDVPDLLPKVCRSGPAPSQN